MKGSYHTHNARAETLLTSPLYKQNVIEGRRCVVLADGYYEWQTTQGVTKHQPYFLYKDPWVRLYYFGRIMYELYICM